MEQAHQLAPGLVVSSAGVSSPAIIVCPTDHVAESVYRQLCFFQEDDRHIRYLPDTETLPYDIDSPHADVVSRRSAIFHALASDPEGITLVVSVSTLLKRIASKEHWSQNLTLRPGDTLNAEHVVQKLTSMGYRPQEIELSDPGDFIVKQQVIDVYASGQGLPCRIKCDADGIVTDILMIDLSSQRSTTAIEELRALPASEFPVDDDHIRRFRREYMNRFERGYHDDAFKSVVNDRDFPSGIEFFLPLFGETTTLFDIMSKGSSTTSVVFIGSAKERVSEAWQHIVTRHEDVSLDTARRIVAPEELWISSQAVDERLSGNHIMALLPEDMQATTPVVSDHQISRKTTLQETVDHVLPLLKRAKRVLFCLNSTDRVSQLEIFCELLGVDPQPVSAWSDFISGSHFFTVVISSIDRGFWLNDESILVLTERDIFGQTIFTKDEALQEKGKTFEQIQDLQNLNIGDPVVHVEYGVGRFLGLEKMVLNERLQEFITIEYAERAKAYVNMDDLHLVSRYGGIAMEDTPLDVMGSPRWRSNLETAILEIRDTARDLLSLEATRASRRGIVMNKPSGSYHRFVNDFPFRETKDQKKAIQDVIEDLMSPLPMDRTVVGDVGFGKTEVALRAAFVAIESGYQVAVMVPTTLLAQQHYETFKSRLERHGKRVALLTRFDRDFEKKTLYQLKHGEVDVVIGTHRVVQSDVDFQSLGLLVVDEEHRFGVHQKSLLAELRKNLNVLSLTATPIPRTLGMALQGVRDLSIISTAPSKRLSIRTFVRERDDRVIAEAIEREMMREGQVFYLHNKTEDLEARVKQIQKLSPGARIRYAHGQMPEDLLTSIMRDFYEHKFDILVCTTIIEIGIDIPNANTILIESANNFGLAQLHQLRGRVGRSHHQGYAYLMIDDFEDISESAQKRLYAMQKASRLGDGFLIANHDLEIRGAGELLGEEQSGHIRNIGFSLYMRLLNNALGMIKRHMKPADITDFEAKLDVEIGLSGVIDDRYIASNRMRLSLYKRFSDIRSRQEMGLIREEMEDRFGPVPDSTQHLLLLSQVRCSLRELGVRKVVADHDGLIMEVRESPMLRLDKMIDMVNQGGSAFKLLSPTKFRLDIPLSDPYERINVIFEVLSEFTADEALAA